MTSPFKEFEANARKVYGDRHYMQRVAAHFDLSPSTVWRQLNGKLPLNQRMAKAVAAYALCNWRYDPDTNKVGIWTPME